MYSTSRSMDSVLVIHAQYSMVYTAHPEYLMGLQGNWYLQYTPLDTVINIMCSFVYCANLRYIVWKELYTLVCCVGCFLNWYRMTSTGRCRQNFICCKFVIESSSPKKLKLFLGNCSWITNYTQMLVQFLFLVPIIQDFILSPKPVHVVQRHCKLVLAFNSCSRYPVAQSHIPHCSDYCWYAYFA